jgi:hypothetical protein
MVWSYHRYKEDEQQFIRGLFRLPEILKAFSHEWNFALSKSY